MASSPAQPTPAPRPPIDPSVDRDAIVIGSGSGGLTVAAGLARFGRRVLLVEHRDVGGDCTNVGCIPSKSLLHLTGGGTGPTGARDILGRVRRRRDQLRDHEEVEFGGMDGIDLHFGHARLAGGTTVAIDQADGTTITVQAPHVVIATGSTSRVLDIDGLPAERVLTNETVFELTTPPRHLVVVGAGAVGLELAVAFARMGTDVTVLEAAGQILPGLLPDAVEVVTSALSELDIDLRPGIVAHRFDPATATLTVGPLDGPDNATLADVDKVLMALGRVPNVDRVDVAAAGVATADDGRIAIDHRGRTNVDGIWAVGDVTTRGGTTHAAGAWGRRVVQSIVAPLVPLGRRPLEPGVVFTRPEVATIGDQPEAVPDDVHRFTIDAAGTDRAYTDEVAHAIMIVDVRKFTARIVGATIVGPRAGELIATCSLLMQADIGLHRLVNMVIAYPTHADVFRALEDAWMARALPRVHHDLGSWVRARLGR